MCRRKVKWPHSRGHFFRRDGRLVAAVLSDYRAIQPFYGHFPAIFAIAVVPLTIEPRVPIVIAGTYPNAARTELDLRERRSRGKKSGRGE